MRSINIVNFLRGSEPRSAVDLLLPAQKQMELVKARNLPATWLLQYDALVEGPYVEFLRSNMAKSHEVGLWFEMNRQHCEAAGVEWRGRPGLTWDSHPDVAFTIGYTPDERKKLADAAMQGFKRIWGFYPRSIASWNLDSFTIGYLAEKYPGAVQALAVCRDQIATDGFTIWGAPIAGYYPSKRNCWSPATRTQEQIKIPIFRMLGQDPVYYYDNQFKLPDGRTIREPDTMEPVWTSGRDQTFIDRFLKMISADPTLQFAYAQLGQENNFGWESMEPAYERQMDALVKLRDAKSVTFETMGETGRRFIERFDLTPTQAQVMLDDPFGNTDPAERSIWYQSRFYRANLHIRGDLAYLRDLTVYSDEHKQPFLESATRDREVHQRLPAMLDGFHWRRDGVDGEPGAGGFFSVAGEAVRVTGRPIVTEKGDTMHVELPIAGERTLHVTFEETKMHVRGVSKQRTSSVGLAFRWNATKAALVDVAATRASYRWETLDYAMKIVSGHAALDSDGFIITSKPGELLSLSLDQ
jgi:hypothetical protein